MTRMHTHAHARRALGVGSLASIALLAHVAGAQPSPAESDAPSEDTRSPAETSDAETSDAETDDGATKGGATNDGARNAANARKRRRHARRSEVDEVDEVADERSLPPTRHALQPSSLPRLPYVSGMPVPDGYHLEQTPRWRLVAGGASLTTAMWLASLVSAIVLDSEGTDDGDPNFDDRYSPMFIPVAGPFITIATADSSGTGAAILALDGVLQTAGVAMLIAGFAVPTVELAPNYELKVAPLASADTGGFSLSGSF